MALSVHNHIDDQPLFTLCDQTTTHGRIGLWTKSDAVTYFEELPLGIPP